MANAKGKKRRKVLILSAIAAGLVSLTLGAIFWKKEVVITVQTEKVTRRNLTELVVANGRIQPVVSVVINPEVSGEIVELPVKEGQQVQKGDLLVRIKPDNYRAVRNSSEAMYLSAIAARNLAEANLRKAQLEFQRFEQLFRDKLVSDSQHLEAKTALDVMKAGHESSGHQVEQAKAALAKADDDLAKTTIYAPTNGTVIKLRSQVGERVVGTALMAGTEIMTIANLDDMEARVDIGEVDIVLIRPGQKARLEVDAFRDRKFSGIVTEIANSAKGISGLSGASSGAASQEATKFEVKIRVQEKEQFRPGMSITSEVETRYRTNVLTVPIQSVTTRLPKQPDEKTKNACETNGVAANHGATNSTRASNEPPAAATATNKPGEGRKPGEGPKPIEVVFLLDGERAKMVPVKRGVSDDTYVEITEGLQEGQEVVSGGYKAIIRELEDGKKVRKGTPPKDENKDQKE